MKLSVEKLEICIKDFSLNCVNLDFNTGDLVLISAPNGSGKSMFLKGLTGLVRTQTRTIRIDGIDIAKLALSEFIAAYLGEEFLIPFYKPTEYFELIGKIKGLKSPELKLVIERLGELFKQNWPQKQIRELSTGLRKKVGLAGSLIGSPQIILWDEPFDNIDIEGQRIIDDFLKSDKRLVIYSSPVKEGLPFSSLLTIESGSVIMENRY